jgi:hypothetical protein
MLDFLDVAIGLIFMFTLLSLIASALSEWFSAMISLRGRMLWRAIEQLLGAKLRSELQAAPLVRGLARGRRLLGERAPSYLKAEVFTLALLHHGFKALTKGETGEPGDLADLQKALRQGMAIPDERTRDEKMRAFSHVAGALLPLIDDAVDLSEAKRNIAAWYDAVMDRLSGVYARWMQAMMFGIGLVLAGGFGVDACAITRSLWENPALRDSTVDLASAFAEDHEIQAPMTVPNPNPIPAGKAVNSSKDPCTVEPPRTPMELRMCQAGVYAADLQRSRLPLYPLNAHDNLTDWLREHWLGFLLTAMATAMGAPFWFDLLSRFISLRTSVKPTQKQQQPSQIT